MWNLARVIRQLGTREQGIAFAVEQGLVRGEKLCPIHRVPMNIDLKANNTVGQYYCGKKSCQGKSRRSRTEGTWFDNVKINLVHVYYLMYCFAHRWTQDNVIHEDPYRDEFGRCLSRVTITDWYSYCREVVVAYQIDMQEEKEKIGGPGKVFQIDESKFGKRKYNKGN